MSDASLTEANSVDVNMEEQPSGAEDASQAVDPMVDHAYSKTDDNTATSIANRTSYCSDLQLAQEPAGQIEDPLSSHGTSLSAVTVYIKEEPPCEDRDAAALRVRELQIKQELDSEFSDTQALREHDSQVKQELECEFSDTLLVGLEDPLCPGHVAKHEMVTAPEGFSSPPHKYIKRSPRLAEASRSRGSATPGHAPGPRTPSKAPFVSPKPDTPRSRRALAPRGRLPRDDMTVNILVDSASDCDGSSGDEDEDLHGVGGLTLEGGLRALVGRWCAEELEDDADEVEEDVAEGDAAGGEVRGEALGAGLAWSRDYTTFSERPESYIRNPGPTHATQDPAELFMLIWDLPIVAKIVEETNRYAWQVIAALSEVNKITRNLDAWQETTVPEMYLYFGILIYMSLCARGRINEYWETGPLEMPLFRGLMSRNRFQMISRFLHFTDNFGLQHNMSAYDKKMAKISPILNHCNRKFSSLYTPTRHLSLDESLLLWKGRLSWAQCIRTKAARFGIKTYELCEATTGYLLKCVIYAGRDASMHSGPIGGFNNVTAKVVLRVMHGYLDVGHCLVMDSWYNQIGLTVYLKRERRTDVLGTLSRRRAHVPTDIRELSPTSLARGTAVSSHCGDISITAWADIKIVAVMSTFHPHAMIAGKREKPAVVDEYNKYMGGVDLKDQKLSAYPMERKRGTKWYIKVFGRLLNTSLLNAYIMYQHNPMLRVLSHREFRKKVAADLCKRFGPPPSAPVPLPLVPGLSVTARSSRDAVRLDKQRDHYPMNTPPVSARATVHARRRCARCCARRGDEKVDKRVTSMCSKCQVPLCLGTCWVEYHTLPSLS